MALTSNSCPRRFTKLSLNYNYTLRNLGIKIKKRKIKNMTMSYSQ